MTKKFGNTTMEVDDNLVVQNTFFSALLSPEELRDIQFNHEQHCIKWVDKNRALIEEGKII